MNAVQLLVVVALVAAGQAPGASSSPPILVELFTSQGCSSCPPADRLLSRLATEPDILALSFHVDYWNRLGWADPFSSVDWSKRQQLYARRFRLDGAYTPQVVLDGRREMVGSDERQIREALADLRRANSSSPAAATLRLEAEWRPREVAVRVDLSAEDGKPLPAGTRLLVAVVESGLVTEVPRGENAHKTLRHDRVVRHLETRKLPPLDASSGQPSRTELTLAVASTWRARHLSVVVFLQDERSGRVFASAGAANSQN